LEINRIRAVVPFVVSALAFFSCVSTPAVIKPAEFIVNNVEVSPANALQGQLIVISAEIANIGGVEGEYIFIAAVDGEEKHRQAVIIRPSENRTVIFSLMQPSGIGRHVVSAGAQKGYFVINELPVSTPQIKQEEIKNSEPVVKQVSDWVYYPNSDVLWRTIRDSSPTIVGYLSGCPQSGVIMNSSTFTMTEVTINGILITTLISAGQEYSYDKTGEVKSGPYVRTGPGCSDKNVLKWKWRK
jgi:hypothetical protein